MIGIGMLFGGDGSEDPNIEDTLVAASIAGVDGDFRVLSILTDWLDIHLRIVNADRLIQLVSALDDEQVKRYWIAITQWKKTDQRLARLRRKGRGGRQSLTNKLSDFQLKKYGEDERFAKTKLIVPKHLLRHRPKDIAPPEFLAKKHHGYKYRLIIGPTYRADLWAVLEREGDLTITELARRTYSSIGTAWEVKKNWDLLKGEP